MTRVLSGSIKIDGVDDENVVSNETISVSRDIEPIYLDLNEPNFNLMVGPVKWGGECRVEIDVDASLIVGEQILIKGRAKLFEGTSEETDDLEDEKEIKFFVPKNTKSNREPTVYKVKLASTGIGGGDSATIVFKCSNLIGEE
jgi:hypothetical protein